MSRGRIEPFSLLFLINYKYNHSENQFILSKGEIIMRIELDTQYQLSREMFMKIIRDYPCVPFLVETNEREFYRWHNGGLEIRRTDRSWKPSILHETEEDLITFVVLKSAFVPSMDEIADKVTISIDKKKNR